MFPSISSFIVHRLFKPRLAQGDEPAFYYRWIFVGSYLPHNLQREIGIYPQDFCHLSLGLFLQL